MKKIYKFKNIIDGKSTVIKENLAKDFEFDFEFFNKYCDFFNLFLKIVWLKPKRFKANISSKH